MVPGSLTSDTELIARADRAARRRATVGRGRRATTMPRLEGAFSASSSMDERAVRRARPARLPAARARPLDGALGARDRDLRARHRRRHVRARRRARARCRDRRDGRALRQAVRRARAKLCLFEFVYFARPDTHRRPGVHDGAPAHGRGARRQAPVEADMVMPVPESGIPAAEGYAARAGIPYGDGLVKNRYVGRTFIQPDQEQRGAGVRLKLNPLRDNIEGQAPGRRRRLDRARHDDAPDRADAARGRRRRGALPRSRSPPIAGRASTGSTWPASDELLAADLSIEEMRERLGATRSPTSRSTVSPTRRTSRPRASAGPA